MDEMAAQIMLRRLLLATALGATIGFEREYRRQPAGLRTNILITLGSALFTALSLEFGGLQGSTDRVAAQIVTGIGFLGAGAVLRGGSGGSGGSDGSNVHRLTTAATIWVNAAIGMAAGMGSYAVATGTTVIVLVVLIVLPFVEQFVERRGGPTTSSTSSARL